MSEDYEYDYRAPAIICAVLGGGLIALFVFAVIFQDEDDGANIGASFALVVGIAFAVVAGYYWTKPPPGPRQ